MNKSYRRRRSPYGFGFMGVEDTASVQKMARASLEIFAKHGFERVMPPTLDYPETFSDFDAKNLFVSRDHLGEELSIRNDVTVQIIKGFANLLDVAPDKSQYRFSYALPVFNDTSRSHPAAREIYQLGCELIGAHSEQILPELLEIAFAVTKEITPNPMKLLIGDTNVAFAIFESMPKTLRENARDLIIRRDAVSFADLLTQADWPQKLAVEFSRLLFFRPDNTQDFLDRIKKVCPHDTIIDALENSHQKIRPFMKSDLPLEWEPLILRKSHYYTGLIFEGYFSGLVSPPLRGGSYDNLVGEYSTNEMPASGFAYDLSLMLKLAKLG